MTIRRLYLTGMRAVCDVLGHRWTAHAGEDGHRFLKCGRCRTFRFGTPVPPD